MILLRSDGYFVQPVYRLWSKKMSIKVIKDFSDLARTDEALKEKLKACLKLKEVLMLAKEHGYEIIEDELYPPNEPQFTEEQLSEKMAKALLRV
jgi:predicted ribosomally synthesized peptide with nif11-like leader